MPNTSPALRLDSPDSWILRPTSKRSSLLYFNRNLLVRSDSEMYMIIYSYCTTSHIFVSSFSLPLQLRSLLYTMKKPLKHLNLVFSGAKCLDFKGCAVKCHGASSCTSCGTPVSALPALRLAIAGLGVPIQVAFSQIKDLGKLCISPARRITDTGRALFFRSCCLLICYFLAAAAC